MSNFPEEILNAYLWEQFKTNGSEYIPTFTLSQYKNIVPIFPVSDNKSGDAKWAGKTYIIYDSFMKMRTSNKYFYPVKSAQIMYSIRGAKLEELFEWRDFIFIVLDREDAAANDINQFAGEVFDNVSIRFHCINAMQNNYIGNTTETLGTQKTFSTNLIVKYDYHSSNIYNNG